MEEKKLRQYDFVTALGLIIFSFWELGQAFKMPMKESYGGVQNDWYVSPALLPIFIGLGLLLLGIILMINAIKSGGATSFINAVKNSKNFKISVPTKRIFTILLGLFTFIFLLIPHVDFFLSIVLFLYFITVAFFSDSEEFRGKITTQFLIAAVVFSIFLITGMDQVLIGLFKYSLDVITLLYIVFMNVYSRLEGNNMKLDVKKYKLLTIVSIAVPLILCPLFRYFLLVPLPVEGGIIKLMNLLYYTIR